MQYVVHSGPPNGEPEFEKPFKAVSDRGSATQFAESEVCGDAFNASVYEVAVDSASKETAARELTSEFKKSRLRVDRPFTPDELL